jgi:hypothetical protein
MNHRRTACAAISLALSFGVLAVAASASAASYDGHAMRKYGPSEAQIAQSIQQAQWADTVRALDSGSAVLPPVASVPSARDIQQAQWADTVRALDSGSAVLPPVASVQAALDKQSAQYAAEVRSLNEGTASLPSGDLRPVLPGSGPLSGSGNSFGYWLTIGLLSGLLALAMSMVSMLLRRRPRPQLSV